MWELKQHPANSLKWIPSCRQFILFYLIYLCMHLLHQPWNFSNLHMQPFLHLLRFSLLAVNDELVGLILLVGKKKPNQVFIFIFPFYFVLVSKMHSLHSFRATLSSCNINYVFFYCTFSFMTARISFICLIGIWEVVIYTHPKLHNKFIIIFFVSSHLKQ